MMNIRDRLEQVVVDWSDFNAAASETRDLIRALAADKAALREMVLAVGRNEHLLSLCQRHRELIYLVIYDALERGLRIRIHQPRVGLFDLPHDHRFSFSTLLLKGCYAHTIYRPIPPTEQGAEALETWSLRCRPGVDPRTEMSLPISDLISVWTQEQQAGSSYSLHHSAIHTTVLPTERTFTLFLRGPAEKDRSLVMDRPARRYWWKYGRADESAQEMDQTAMAIEHYEEFVEQMEDAGLI